MTDDPYLVLGVNPGASLDEVAQAYRALAQIYHPDRYVGASARVQAEANKRMQALNAAFGQLGRSTHAAPPPPPESTPPPRWEPPPTPPRSLFVHYVDGARGFHNGDIAPLGFGGVGEVVQPLPAAQQCPKLDSELLAWFDLQRRNADFATKQLYASWTPEEQALYAAKLGCTQIPREKARSFGVPCGACGG